MKKIVFLVLTMISHSSLLIAQETEMTLEEKMKLGEANIATCVACHNQDGNSSVPSYPKLAGQNVKYLLKQLQEIKSGDRSAPLMTGLLDDFTDQDLEAIATYYSQQKPTIGRAKKENLELGELIYRAGNLEAGIPACTGCHSPNGTGNSAAGFPALSGQHAEYTASQLRAFRSKERSNGPMMMDISERLSDAEIDAVSNYINGLH